MKKFEIPEIEVHKLNVEDVIVTSGTLEEDELPFVPAPKTSDW